MTQTTEKSSAQQNPAVEAPSLEELYATTYEKPLASIRIEPDLSSVPEHPDFGAPIAYNSGVPVQIEDKWYLPVRVEYEKDESNSRVGWWEWTPDVVPESDDHPSNEGGKVIRLPLSKFGIQDQEYLTPGDDQEQQKPARQDPSVWEAALFDEETGERVKLLYESFTEYGPADQLVKVPVDAKDSDPNEEQQYEIKIVKKLGYWTVIRAGVDPDHMEEVWRSELGNKDIFGVANPDGTMVLVTRPQKSDWAGGVEEGGLGKIGLLEIKTLQELKNLSFEAFAEARIVPNIAEKREWTGSKHGYIHGDMLVLDAAHLAANFPVPKGALVMANGIRQKTIRVYGGTRYVIDLRTAKAVYQEVTSVPWDITRHGKPKRDDLEFIAFLCGEVSREAEISLPDDLGIEDRATTRQEIVSHGDSSLWLAVKEAKSPEAYIAENRERVAAGVGSVSIRTIVRGRLLKKYPDTKRQAV